MKPWKPCEHCYLKDKHCENAEREQPCVPVQEYLESSSKIKRLQILLGIYEKKLNIATKALNRIREIYAYNPGMHQYIAQFANRKAKTDLKEMEGVK